ncbi:MAG: alpha/beta fold hydrolase [Leptospirales bacterium]|jgi:carboxylesterase
MSVLWFVCVLLAVLLALGHFGLPEKRLPPPPDPTPARIMAGAEPWRLEGDSGIAFLICHGFRGSPFNVKPLGEFIHSLGHTAIGVLLPGHGTRIEDMARTRFYHLVDFVERHYLAERSKYRKIFLVGFSMGGTICLRVAARNADTFRPAGIITISSPVFFNGFYNGRFIMHQPATVISGILRHIKPILPMGDRPRGTEKLSPWVGYAREVSVECLHSFKLALGEVRRGLSRISVPYCSIIAANDRTVSPENQIYIHNHIQSREKRAFMFILPPDLSTMHTLLTHVRARNRVFRHIESFIRDTLEEYGEREGHEARGRFANGRPGFWKRLLGGSKQPLRQPDNLVDPHTERRASRR